MSSPSLPPGMFATCEPRSLSSQTTFNPPKSYSPQFYSPVANSPSFLVNVTFRVCWLIGASDEQRELSLGDRLVGERQALEQDRTGQDLGEGSEKNRLSESRA
jgi:hypothetical protein